MSQRFRGPARWSAIIDVEGIGEVYADKLKEAGISTTAALLREGSSQAGRKKIEKATGIGHKFILRWTNHVDLYRIKGVQKQYAELLEASGVDSIPELAQRTPSTCTPNWPRSTKRSIWCGSCQRKSEWPIGWPRPKSCLA